MSSKKPFNCKVPRCQPILKAGRVCPHLEKKLPKPAAVSVKTVHAPWVGAKADFQGRPILPPEFDSRVTTVENFHQELGRYQLPAEDIDLLTSRFYYMDTWEETMRELSYTSVGAAQYHYKQAIYRLRARKLAEKKGTHYGDTEDEDTGPEDPSTGRRN